MTKSKSIFVTAIISAMLVIIAIASYRLYKPAFIALVCVFSVAGFISVAVKFCGWLQSPASKAEEILMPPISNSLFDGGDFTATYEQIKRELETGET